MKNINKVLIQVNNKNSLVLFLGYDIIKKIGKTCMETKEWEELCKRIGLQYGPVAEKIVRDRPGLSEEDITNFDIFNKNIIEVLALEE